MESARGLKSELSAGRSQLVASFRVTISSASGFLAPRPLPSAVITVAPPSDSSPSHTPLCSHCSVPAGQPQRARSATRGL